MDHQMTWQNDLAALAADGEFDELPVAAALTDRQLVEQVLAGDDAAFETIFLRYRRLAARTAARFFTRPDDVEELVQISFTKAFFELRKFRGGHEGSFPAWLGRITSNACLDHLRNRKRKPEDLECDLSAAEAETLGRAVRAGDLADGLLANRDLADKLLRALSPVDRALMRMLYAEEMSIAEAADLLGWSHSKVKVRAWRARHTLRTAMKKYL